MLHRYSWDQRQLDFQRSSLIPVIDPHLGGLEMTERCPAKQCTVTNMRKKNASLSKQMALEMSCRNDLELVVHEAISNKILLAELEFKQLEIEVVDSYIVRNNASIVGKTFHHVWKVKLEENVKENI